MSLVELMYGPLPGAHVSDASKRNEMNSKPPNPVTGSKTGDATNAASDHESNDQSE